MGRVDFGAKVIENEGVELHVPEIYITVGEKDDAVQIVFTSNLLLRSVEECEEFTHHLFNILKGPRDPSEVNYYPGGSTSESGSLN